MNAHKEGSLHTEHTLAIVAMQYMITGWIMYLAAIQTLLFGSRVVLYVGSPFVPDINALLTVSA